MDSVVSGQNWTFGYDALGRLITASGPWGSGSFTYDPLGNVRQQVLGSRTVDVDYNTQNRMSQVRDTATGSVWRNYAYDTRGDTTGNGEFNWTYDRSEQPVSMSGGVAFIRSPGSNDRCATGCEAIQITDLGSPTPNCAFWGTRPLAFEFGNLTPASHSQSKQQSGRPASPQRSYPVDSRFSPIWTRLSTSMRSSPPHTPTIRASSQPSPTR